MDGRNAGSWTPKHRHPESSLDTAFVLPVEEKLRVESVDAGGADRQKLN
jgi:hypothetical protein